ADEKQQGDDQARDEQVGVPVSTTHKEKHNLLQSTSSHSVSSNFEINSLLDIQIQQEVPTIQQEPLHEVKVSVPSAVDKYLGSSLGDTLQKVLQRHTEELIQQYPQKDESEIIKIKQEHVAKEKMIKYSTTTFDQAANDEYL
nr:hypothetical protein [Tanacetum cinerariifolium]